MNIIIPIDQEFDVTPDSLYPQTPEMMYVYEYEMDLDDFADDFTDFLFAPVKEGDVYQFESDEFNKFCDIFNINKDKLNDDITQLECVIGMIGADKLFEYIPVYREYFITQHEEDIIEQYAQKEYERERQEEIELEHNKARAFDIISKLFLHITIEKSPQQDDFSLYFGKVRSKVLLTPSEANITEEEYNILEELGVEVEK